MYLPLEISSLRNKNYAAELHNGLGNLSLPGRLMRGNDFYIDSNFINERRIHA